MRIEVMTGEGRGRACDLDGGECLIGRDPQCTIRLNDPEVSRRHARITVAAGEAWVEDLDSRNGTLLNGRPIRRGRLAAGDEVRVGACRLRAGASAPEAEPATAGPREAEDDVRVLASVQHEEADLLAGASLAASESDALHENRVLRKLCEISNIFASGHERAALTTVLDRAKAVLDADTACILLRREDEETWEVHAVSSDTPRGESPPVSRTIIAAAVKEGNAILAGNPLSDERFAASESIVRQRITTAVCAPLKIEDTFSGVLFLDRVNRREVFTPLDLRFAATVANMLGVVLERTRYYEEYVKRERLAAVGQVIAGLAHYAKNIITGLRLSVETLQRAVKRRGVEGFDACVTSIVTEERRLSDLILDMLTYAREREPVRTEVPLADVVRAVAAPYTDHLREAGISLDLALQPDTPAIEADRSAMHRVILNVFLNAVDALAGCRKENKRIRIELAPAETGRTVRLRITDTGCGMPREHLGKIFGVFFSTKGSKGTGLGLAVVHKIVQEHGGRITADSEAGAWTAFTIDLPVSPQRAATARRAQS
ncbi:MAG: FHA domain-containing protein [Lentisphaerae bacterium]|nr:FHA domain-containing protein [Lentisphaerota bacterium]